MSLNETYDTVNWPETHYIYIEKVGPFLQSAPQAWQELLKFAPDLAQTGLMKNGFSLYKVGPQIYRAGFAFSKKPDNIPAGLNYMLFEGGNHIRFALKGSYSQLPQACSRVFEIIDSKKIKTDDSDRFFVENYVNDPMSTPEEQLITEILVPIK